MGTEDDQGHDIEGDTMFCAECTHCHSNQRYCTMYGMVLIKRHTACAGFVWRLNDLGEDLDEEEFSDCECCPCKGTAGCDLCEYEKK